jgi:phage terminase large subunit-like protein
VTGARGVPDLVDTLQVKHVSGDLSRIALKSYEKGREKWQGETLDWVWFDEEPPLAIYTEGLTRTNVAQGPVWMTFTPLLGMSETVSRFILEQSPARHVTTMTIDDAEHYTPEQRAAIAATYPPHEREARLKGTPALGSGRIFPVTQESITVDALPIAPHWAQIGGLDFGWDHPTAAVKLAWDRDADVVYVAASYRVSEATPLIHAGALKPWGTSLPWAWPHDGLAHDRTSGEQLAEVYRKHGLKLLPDKAEFEDGTSGVEAGLLVMLERMQTGRLKVFRHLADWLEEFRLYHREDGKVLKLRDDLMSATRYALMCLRFAKPIGGGSFTRKIEYPASGVV